MEEQQKQPGQGEEEEEGSPAAKAKIEQQCPPPMTGTASSEVMRVWPNAAAAAALPELAALPQEWTY